MPGSENLDPAGNPGPWAPTTIVSQGGAGVKLRLQWLWCERASAILRRMPCGVACRAMPIGVEWPPRHGSER